MLCVLVGMGSQYDANIIRESCSLKETDMVVFVLTCWCGGICKRLKQGRLVHM